MFVVRYTPDTQAALARHTDDADISFNILLNEDFQGGGTKFWQRSSMEPFVTVKPARAGQVLIHSATLLHEGWKVTEGTRLILVGFLYTDRVHSLSKKSTRMSWFSSWFSLAYLHVQMKQQLAKAYRKLEDNQRSSGEDHPSPSSSSWTDSSFVRSLLPELILLVQQLGDMICPHRHYNLVEEHNAEAFIQAFRGSTFERGLWFSGQQIDPHTTPPPTTTKAPSRPLSNGNNNEHEL